MASRPEFPRGDEEDRLCRNENLDGAGSLSLRGRGQMTWLERWDDSAGMLFILCAEFFGTGMAVAARLLEMGGSGMGALQIMFVRFTITTLLSSLYMWSTSVPDFPLGKPEIRGLLVLRGVGGCVGVYGFYNSLRYLPVAEAILLTFTAPIFTAYACYLFLSTPFEKKQLIAGIISFFGVILIARPGPLATIAPNSGTRLSNGNMATSAERLSAVILGLLGVLGAVCAYTAIRAIGSQAHPLISVNYYAVITTLFSGATLALPIFSELSFRLPRGLREWSLLVGLGVFGFCLQSLTTTGLVKDKSSRATNMMYSGVVFGLIVDWTIWGVVPGWLTWVGGAIVVASTLWGAI